MCYALVRAAPAGVVFCAIVAVPLVPAAGPSASLPDAPRAGGSPLAFTSSTSALPLARFSAVVRGEPGAIYGMHERVRGVGSSAMSAMRVS